MIITAAYFYAEQTISIPTALPVWGATISTHLSLRHLGLVVGAVHLVKPLAAYQASPEQYKLLSTACFTLSLWVTTSKLTIELS